MDVPPVLLHYRWLKATSIYAGLSIIHGKAVSPDFQCCLAQVQGNDSICFTSFVLSVKNSAVKEHALSAGDFVKQFENSRAQVRPTVPETVPSKASITFSYYPRSISFSVYAREMRDKNYQTG